MPVSKATEEMLLKVRGIIPSERQRELAIPGKTNMWTEEERRLIKQVWLTIPPEHCMYDAAWLIAKHGRER